MKTLADRLRRPVTLRTRLLLTLAAVSTVISLAVGGIAVLALQRMAVGGVDARLAGIYQRSLGPGANPDGRPPPEQVPDARSPAGLTPVERVHSFLERPGQSVGTLAAEVPRDGGRPVAAVLDASGAASDLTPQTARALAGHTSAAPNTVSLDGLGDYRVAAAPLPVPQNAASALVVGLPLADTQATVYRLAAVLAVVALIGVAVVLSVGGALLRVALRPLERVRTTAVRVSELPLERGDVALAERVPDADPRTEVGQVGIAFNRMLEHVAAALAVRQRSEMRLRRFVADASHELRTPLASVRGYAELMRRRPEPLPPDVAHALSRVESEAIRMGGLVEDMLLLARLDEGRPLARELVDLTRMVREAAGDAAVTAPDHHWQVDLPDRAVSVLGDPARLTQVVVNLLANARTHTPGGTTVQVTLSLQGVSDDAGPDDGRDAVLVVADNGPGMAGDLAAEAFERFTRGEVSRSRVAGSTGLGLAIVDAVVRAHGGTARLVSAPGSGTWVTVRLPAVVDDSDPKPEYVIGATPAQERTSTGTSGTADSSSATRVPARDPGRLSRSGS